MIVFVVMYNSWYQFGEVQAVFRELTGAIAFIESKIAGSDFKMNGQKYSWASQAGQEDYTIEKMEVLG